MIGRGVMDGWDGDGGRWELGRAVGLPIDL